MTTRLRSDMKSQEYPQARGPIGYTFLSRKELSLFRRLIDDRRPLPIYRAGGWLCYECSFASTDLAAMARHIARAHGAAPANEDDLDEDDSDPAYQAGRAGGLLSVSSRAQNILSSPPDDERQGKSLVHPGDKRVFRVIHEIARVGFANGYWPDLR